MKLVYGVVVACLAVSSLSAQSTTGELRGTVQDSAGRGIEGVRVSVTGPLVLGTRSTTTDRDGGFAVLALAPGMVSVRLQSIGYVPVVIDSVRISLGSVLRVPPVRLTTAVVGLDERRIVATAIGLGSDNSGWGASLHAREIAALPTDRDYTSVISLLPHVNRSYRGEGVNVAGATGTENAYFVDGVNLTDPVRSASGTRLPYNFIRTIEVKSGGYEAQYGRALGGLVQALTYSGSNEFESAAFAFATTDALAATARGVTLLPERTLDYDIGLRVSGPITRDRLWFSLAYNPRFGEVDRRVSTLGVYTDSRTAHIFAGKATWGVSPNTNVEFALFGDPETRTAVEQSWLDPTLVPSSASPFLTDRRTGGIMASARVNTVLRDVAVEGSLARAQSRNVLRNADPSTPNFSYVDAAAHTVAGGWPEWSAGGIERSTARLKFTRQRIAHTLVLGIETEVAANRTSAGQRNITRVSATEWTEDSFSFDDQNLRNISHVAFLQDSWDVGPDLTLNLGLRWSMQTLTGARGTVAQRFEHEWQPRAGFVWYPGGDRRGRLVGSYGRFYQQSALWLSGGWYSDFTERECTYSTDPRVSGATPDSCVGGPVQFDPAAFRAPNAALDHHDEFALGYEREVASHTRAAVRVVRRDLRSSFQIGHDFRQTQPWHTGTPGRGDLAYLPPPRREYTALELSADGSLGPMRWRGTYVLSRSYGNYPGSFDAAFGVATPGFNRTFATPDQAVNSTGLLPNDRTHVAKLSFVLPVGFGTTVSSVATWSSGTPINAFAPCSCSDLRTWIPAFTVPRGTAGRTPSVWTADLRVTRELALGDRTLGRVLLDILNVGNPQAVVWQNEFAYASNAGGSPSGPRADFKAPLAFQPPMMLRIGVEIDR